MRHHSYIFLILFLFWFQGSKSFGQTRFIHTPFLNNNLINFFPKYTSNHNFFVSFNDSTQKTNSAGSQTLRFFIITVGAFPLVYLISYPIIIASTRQNNWSQNKQILTAMAVSGGISLSISLIDLFIGMGKKESRGYSAI